MTPECAVVMPVYNEAGCIEAVCLDWLAQLEPRGHVLLVVDDGSTDATAAVLARLAGKHPSLRLLRKANGGHGSAVLHGYREALKTGCQWVFQVDSDGQFVAEDFTLLWSRREESDFILGRRAGRQDPLYRRVLSKFHRYLLTALFGVSVSDPNVPYRLMRSSVLKDLMKFVPAGAFAPNVFLAVLARKAGHASLDIPVRHLARAAGESTLKIDKMVRLCRLCAAELWNFRNGEFRSFGRTRPAVEAPVRGA